MIQNHFAPNLRHMRKSKRITAARLARQLGCCTRQNISTWERGTQPGYDMLLRLADHFGVTVDTMLRAKLWIEHQPKQS